ncbi:hypothetical protein OPQ81_005674 [Rhizoctonia solani]|nr:hypothetical protein OPQ81_005674 [Rhizoctonia solani]
MPRIQKLLAKLSLSLGSRQQALRELRWINESIGSHSGSSQALLADKLLKRTEGWPLQYLLGTQPFGSIEILTRPPILIPRPETEYWTLRLAQTLQSHAFKEEPLRMLDLCTVRSFEDPLALLGEVPPSADKLARQTEHDRLGLSFYVRITSILQNHNLVRPGGHVALEVGQGQARSVERMLLPFASQTQVWTDPWGVERVVYARM